MLLADFKIEKKRIARSFSRAAKSYDSHASLQRQVADRLLAQLSPDESAQRVLDLGSGTGYCTKELHRLYPNAEIINLDIAEAMLLFAAGRNIGNSSKEQAICADAEALPFIADSFDRVFSSLSIQWCQNYSVLFSELNRVLKPEGELYFSTFGPGTLQEVAQAWQQIDSFIHVNRFHNAGLIEQEINNNGFCNSRIDTETIQVHYRSFDNMAHELKSIGASNKNPGQAQGLGGRKKISRLRQIFENNTDQKLGIPVTYEVFYLKAKCAKQC